MAKESSLTFTNPVIRGFNPDPTVCVVPATYSTPTTFFLSTSTFEFFPGCAIYTSTNLIDWKLIGHALNRRSQINMRTVEPGAGSWASTLRYRPEEKRWYLANGVFHRYRPTVDERIFPRGFYVWTDNIWDDTAWSDPVYFDNPGFDQDLFWDDDGKVYLSTTMRFSWRDPNSKQKDFGIHISEIDISTGRTLTAPKVIRKSPHGIAEGSHIFRRGDWYYLLTAEGGTEAGHQEWVFRSKDSPLGPWESQGKPLWYNGPDEEVQRTGHVDVFEDGNGDWWSVLLGVRPVQQQGTFLEPQLGRETFLVKVEWKNDWPVFNDGKNITLKTEGRNLIKSASKPSLRIWKADLSKDDLELGWYQKKKPGVLRLYGNCYDLTSPEAPAMLLRKQTSYNQVFKTKMEFKPTVRGYEAGVVLWWSQHSYASLGVVASENYNGKVEAMISYKGASGDANKFKNSETDLKGNLENVELSIRAYPTKYELYLKAGGKESEVYTVNASALTVMPAHGGCFTGTMFGIYSYGKNQPVLDLVDFSYISTEELE
ncbi:xylosidase arabinosidase [Fusarium subglutinans]|uniref:Xylosidase arabinosidase n=1 Tax=Gibberella subglutinans TaxID=42677 RepID=A0A8H5V4Z7_GIBSU|nr:xylosidase arabinosidase [Fusarium subglutinans]KAF5608449.1 xylosidase arabinosidase [Fusarium subglutinans]